MFELNLKSTSSFPSPLAGEGNASAACEGEGKATKQEIVITYLSSFVERSPLTRPRKNAVDLSHKGRGEVINIHNKGQNMIRDARTKKCLFVLDTNVLIHDPTALFRFQEHDVYLPMIVIEELDNSKKGLSEVARNTRQASRFLNEILVDSTQAQIEAGLLIPHYPANDSAKLRPTGKLFLQTEILPTTLPGKLPGDKADNTILIAAHALVEKRPELQIILVSKDINMRIKAAMLGISAEDYYNDKVLDDLDLLYTGTLELPDNFWDTHSQSLESWQEKGHTFYKISGPIINSLSPNQALFNNTDPPFEAIVRECQQNNAIIELANDYRGNHHAVWGIFARNREQNFALNLLMDPKIDFVSIIGTAGTGKTLLALAAGLVQTIEKNIYREIIMTRVTIPVGEDIGFLPGTEEEKMTPWMGALMDNLEVLTQTDVGGEWGRSATNDLLLHRIKIRSLNFMRGRTFLNKYIIIDEAQNLTAKQLQTLVTRAGPGTKIVCIGNLGQIDTPYLTETTSGLTNVVDKFKEWAHSGHITLKRGERSRLADFASEQL